MQKHTHSSLGLIGHILHLLYAIYACVNYNKTHLK